MTFSLIGRCARTGRLGLGITTYSLAVGGRCEGVVANVGVCKTQAFPNRTNDPLGIKLTPPVAVRAPLSASILTVPATVLLPATVPKSRSEILVKVSD